MFKTISSLLIIATSSIAIDAHAVSYRINNDSSFTVGTNFHFTPNSREVVYTSNAGLFVTSVEGGLSTRLNQQTGVTGYHISPNGKFVAYMDDPITRGTEELFVVPITGGSSVKINNPLVPRTDIVELETRFTPDSSRVIFKARGTSIDRYELYSSPITGGGAIEINAPLLNDQVVMATFGVGTEPFRITSDSQKVVYIEESKYSSGFPVKFYSVPVGGGVTTLLDQTSSIELGTSPHTMNISPGNSEVYYTLEGPNFSGIFAAPIDGGQPKLLTPATGEIGYYALSKDGSFIVYPYTPTGQSPVGLFSVSLSSHERVQLFAPSIGADDITSYLISSDSKRVVIRESKIGAGFMGQLFSSPIEGGSVTPLTPLINILEYKLSPDGENVVFTSDFLVPAQRELFSVPIAGGPLTKLSGPLAERGYVRSFEFSPDGSKVIFIANTISRDHGEIFQVPTVGGDAIRIDSDFGPGLNIDYFTNSRIEISPDGRLVAYKILNQSTGRNELHLGVIVPEPTFLVQLLVGFAMVFFHCRARPFVNLNHSFL